MQPDRFERNSLGELTLRETGEALVPVRPFPLSAPETLALVDANGHERVWLESMADLSPEDQARVRASLAERQFMPVVEAVLAVSSYVTPSTWRVRTDRGEASLLLAAEESIRRLPEGRLLIIDAHGLSYDIPNLRQLDRASRRLLDRFL